MKTSVFDGGVPTAPDVKILEDHYGVPEVGDIIPYKDIESVLHIQKNSSRFKTVTNQWRKKIEEDMNHAIIIGVVRGVGFKVLDPSERIDLGSSKLKSGLRSVKRSYKVVSTTDQKELTTEQKKRADHITHITSSLVGAARLEAEKFRMQLPKPVSKK